MGHRDLEVEPRAVDPILRMFEVTFEWLDLHSVDRLVVDGVGPKGAILERPQALEHGYLMGSRLADQPRKREGGRTRS